VDSEIKGSSDATNLLCGPSESTGVMCRLPMDVQGGASQDADLGLCEFTNMVWRNGVLIY
jgi:hypothetical protein